MNMTYQELRDYLDTLTPEELNLNVSIYCGEVDEVWPVMGTSRNTDQDMGEEISILDHNHPMLLI